MKWVLKEPNCVENLWVFEIIKSNEKLKWKFYQEIQVLEIKRTLKVAVMVS